MTHRRLGIDPEGKILGIQPGGEGRQFKPGETSDLGGLKTIDVMKFEYQRIPPGVLPIRVALHNSFDIDPRQDRTDRIRVEFRRSRRSGAGQFSSFYGFDWDDRRPPFFGCKLPLVIHNHR